MNCWELPEQAELDGMRYRIHADFRDVLDILSRLENPDEPEFLRWAQALALFYEEPVPPQSRETAMRWLADFVAGEQAQENTRPAPQLLDWQRDARMIIADVNKVAGCDIRTLPFVHWWSFLAWFGAIGEGQLSMVVSIRDKLRRGKKLEKWEQEYYRENRARIDLPRRYSAEEQQERDRLNQLLGR